MAAPIDPPSFVGADAGMYRAIFPLALESSQEDALMRYTMNPTAPIEERSAWTDYSLPISVDRSVHVRAYAYIVEANPSPEQSIDFEMKVPEPVANVAPGPLTVGTLDLVLTCALAGAEIRYTRDGSIPTADSTLYVAGKPIALTADTIVRAIGFRNGWTSSDLIGGFYDLLNPANFTISLIMPDGTITLPGGGTQLSYAAAADMTVTATPSASISNPTYTWYLNGVAISGATTASITVGATGPAGKLEQGFYTLTLEALAGGYSYSETISFEVEA
jgi:hypothetical protein